MGPKRNPARSARSVPYDINLPDNWTVAKLKAELANLSVSFPKSAKRAQLIAIFKQSTNTTANTVDVAASIFSDSALRGLQASTDLGSSRALPPSVAGASALAQEVSPVNNNNTVTSALRELTATVSSLQNNLKQLSAKVNSIQTAESTVADNAASVPTGEANVMNTLASALQPATLQEPPLVPTAVPTVTGPDHCYVRTKFGFSAESLPFVETVSPQIRKSVVEGKDVNLASLLIPCYNGPACVGDKVGDKDKPDPRLNKVLTLSEFILAFGIYKSIMCEAFPPRRAELDLYERDIVDMGTRYGGSGFMDYHKQFSATAAAHLKHNNLKVDWSVRNNTLFCNIFANCAPVTCTHCASTIHTSGFCPRLLNDGAASSSSSPSSEGRQFASRFQAQGPSRSNLDMHGRTKMLFRGTEICNNFNGERGCFAKRCLYSHVCLLCNRNHSKVLCPQAKNDQPRRPFQRI